MISEFSREVWVSKKVLSTPRYFWTKCHRYSPKSAWLAFLASHYPLAVPFPETCFSLSCSLVQQSIASSHETGWTWNAILLNYFGFVSDCRATCFCCHRGSQNVIVYENVQSFSGSQVTSYFIYYRFLSLYCVESNFQCLGPTLFTPSEARCSEDGFFYQIGKTISQDHHLEWGRRYLQQLPAL